MNKKHLLLITLFLLFFNTGCTLVDPNIRPNTKEYILSDIDDKLTKIEDENTVDITYSSNSEMVEDMSVYGGMKNAQEITNLILPNMNKGKNYRSDLLDTKKHFDHKKVKLSIEAMPLNKFINLVFSKVLNVDFVLDKSIENNTQPVSLNIKNTIPKEKLFDIVLNILDEFKVAINVEKDIFYIKASSQRFVSAQGMFVGASLPSNISDNSIVFIMKPYYYNNKINTYSDIVKSYFLSKNAQLSIDRGEHFIKIKDKAKNIRRAIQFYNFIDKPSMHNKNLKLVRLKHIDVDSFITQVKPILEGYGITISESLRQPGVKLVPIQQINAFLLISDNSSWTNTVLLWKNKLDFPEKKSVEESGFFVYTPANRKADELVNIIQDFVGNRNAENTQDNNRSSLELDSEKSSSLLSNELKVVLDKERNNIIIQSTERQYLEISKMLKKLDTLPKQILIEVTIAEITLRDSMQFGLEWFLKTRGSNYGLTLSALGAGSSGISGILTATSGDFGLNFNALQTNKYVNVLSNPKVMVLNNHSASINIGNQVPIVSSQVSASDLGGGGATPSLLQNIEYRNTGIQLTVQPTINSKGYLTLNINQNVSNAQTNDTSDISSPLIFDRSLTTDVILKSGEMVILGGLITENKSNDKSQLPFLGSIPILGKLFSTASDSIDKTELVIMVKPTILSSSVDAHIVTDALLNLINFQ